MDRSSILLTSTIGESVRTIRTFIYESIKEEIEIEESLESRLRVIRDFCNAIPIIINGSIRRIDKTNLTYIEPHRIYIKNNLYLAFNYSSDIYVNNLGKKIKLSELEDYIKQA